MKFKDMQEGKDYWIKLENVEQDREMNETIGAFNGVKHGFKSDRDIEVIPEREKVTIPKEVADWVVEYKARNSSLRTTLNRGILDGPKEISEWLMSKENQDTFARAWVMGYTVEEPLGVLLLEFHSKSKWRYHYLETEGFEVYIVRVTDRCDVVKGNAHKITESEAKEKYPNFKWVSLEELDGEQYGK